MHFQLLTQSDDFGKSIAFAWWPIFGYFQNAVIFRILAVFWSRFCLEQLKCVVERYLASFYAFLIFDPK